MPEEIKEILTATERVKSKLQLIVLVITSIATTSGMVYSANEYLDTFATDADVATVQYQFRQQLYQGQIESFEEKQFTIEDKIVDNEASKSDRKKLIRIKAKIQKIKEKVMNF